MKTSKRKWPLSRRSILAGVAAGAGTAVLKGCVPADPRGTLDSGFLDPDSGIAPPDSGTDAGLDAGTDAGIKTEVDGGTDGGPDAGTDGGVTPQCVETEENILGPYYRPNAPFRTVFSSPSDGEWLVITGTCSGVGGASKTCEPLEGMLLDVWAANGAADYDMTNPNFLYRGRLNAGSGGAYKFETVLPGHYLNGNQYRPRHLHLIASHPGHVSLTTQIYFQGDPYLSIDPFVHPALVVPLNKVNGIWQAHFPIVLART